MLSYQTVEPHTLELLKQLMAESSLLDTRLVGGTSLALQYGHRSSVDLDFFGKLDDDMFVLRDCLKSMGQLLVIKETRNIRVYDLDGVKIDFVDYSRYPWLTDAVIEDGMRLASPQDIAAMKINAIEGRGTRKDFVDIYFLMQHYSLEGVLSFYQEKYPENSLFRALMSLSYFEDAEKQVMPKMFSPVSWDEMKAYIIKEVERIT
ncbi:MAG: nucleotidyl transferase AbiEii/AbiGii toxin family protein [Prevotella sp.]|nr:nucleotidyl transferase AbiEii/AbiGii toxin family protein [Prevotella sp.]